MEHEDFHLPVSSFKVRSVCGTIHALPCMSKMGLIKQSLFGSVWYLFLYMCLSNILTSITVFELYIKFLKWVNEGCLKHFILSEVKFFCFDTGLETKFQFCVSSVTFLMPLMSTAQELLFLEGFGSSHSQVILSVHVRSIVESAPEDRLVLLVETL